MSSGALIGSMIFKPTADRMNALIAKEGITPAALAEGRRILKVARFDYTVMMLVVADMVLKPTLDDAGTLAVMSALLAAGAASAFGGINRTAEARA